MSIRTIPAIVLATVFLSFPIFAQEKVLYYSGSKEIGAKYDKSVEIDDKLFQEGWMFFHENGEVLFGMTGEKMTVSLPKESWYSSTKKVQLDKKSGVTFYLNGTLHSGTIVETVTISDLEIPKGSHVLLSEDGYLEMVIVNLRDRNFGSSYEWLSMTVDDVVWPSGTTLFFSGDDETVLERAIVRGCKYQKEKDLKFGVEINGKTYAAGKDLTFDEDGSVIKEANFPGVGHRTHVEFKWVSHWGHVIDVFDLQLEDEDGKPFSH